jgi:hypothetical protein
MTHLTMSVPMVIIFYYDYANSYLLFLGFTLLYFGTPKFEMLRLVLLKSEPQPMLHVCLRNSALNCNTVCFVIKSLDLEK